MGEWLIDLLNEMDESDNEDVRAYAARIRVSLKYLLEETQDRFHVQTGLVDTPWEETPDEV